MTRKFTFSLTAFGASLLAGAGLLVLALVLPPT